MFYFVFFCGISWMASAWWVGSNPMKLTALIASLVSLACIKRMLRTNELWANKSNAEILSASHNRLIFQSSYESNSTQLRFSPMKGVAKIHKFRKVFHFLNFIHFSFHLVHGSSVISAFFSAKIWAHVESSKVADTLIEPNPPSTCQGTCRRVTFNAFNILSLFPSFLRYVEVKKVEVATFAAFLLNRVFSSKRISSQDILKVNHQTTSWHKRNIKQSKRNHITQDTTIEYNRSENKTPQI